MPLNKFKKSLINGFALASLLVAFYIGQSSQKETDEFSKSQVFRERQIDKVCKKNGNIAAYSQNHLIGYVSIGNSQGYGGPMKVLLLSDTIGNTMDIELIQNSETHAYIEKLKNKRYFEQYPNKKVNDKYLIRSDISVVSGATVSSNAIALASREAAWNIAKNKFSLPLPDVGIRWEIGKYELIVVLIFILALIATQLKYKKLRYIVLFSSCLVIGFLLNASISLSHIGRLCLAYIPDIRHHFVWWILVFGNLLAIAVMGKNVYCNSICPFHAGQIFLNKISGVNFKIHPGLSKHLIQTPKYLLWLSLILILISKNPTISSYEPFAMFFSLEGMGIQWYILPAALIGSLFISDFFCHYFCPVGASFRFLIEKRNKLKHLIRKHHE
ncbi:FMN-binding protein [Ancylomarina longa]|uniref:FMN-binding protein n=1 Tax=Ancylomarina longa TaxID=2487017 RepID=A0A434AZ44_9BACT|nr:FMN-binding protein [Ancylomarina longa]RUT79891.1 FMN-binding protein [Ancylomarina longa]